MGYKVSNGRNISPVEPSCKKTIYHSMEEARDMIDYINSNRVTREIRPYKCDLCGFWHLTSSKSKKG